MRPQQQPLPSKTKIGGPALAAWAAVLFALAPLSAQAQSIFPPNEPRVIFDEDVSTATGGNLPTSILRYDWTQNSGGVGSTPTAPACGGAFWGTNLVQTSGQAAFGTINPPDAFGNANRTSPLGPSGKSSVFVVEQSVPGNTGYLATDWENFRFEFDFTANANAAVGVVWGAQATTTKVDHGYLFYIDDMPTQAEAVADPDVRARWHLVRRQAQYDLEIDSGELVLNPGDNNLLSVFNSACYRLRLEFFCDTLRVSVARINCGATDCTVTQCGGTTTTCSPAGDDSYGACAPNDIDWCTVLDWVDPEPMSGFVGPFAGGTDRVALGESHFDNLVARTWDYDCEVVCPDLPLQVDAWTDWTDDWDAAAGREGVEDFDLKYLYTGTLLDYQYGWVFRNDWQDSFIDITMKTEPTDVILTDGTPVTRDQCGGWTVLYENVEKPIVDLPSWDTNDSNVDELLAFLQPMSSAIKLVYDSSASPSLSFVDDFDNRRDIAGVTNPAYNPAPLSTMGMTPINNSLTDAFDWYVNQRTNGDYADDPLEDCRLWYVIFITDGEESCCAGGDCDPDTNPVVPDWACQANQAAEKFANPAAFGYPGIDPVAVYTVGFSEGVAADSPLQCVADITGGRFFSATNAGQLVDVLYDVLDEMQETDRSFLPYAVSPPPPSAAGQLLTDDEFLTVFPHFVPINQRSIWNGDLLAFSFSAAQPTLPTTADCTVDTSQVVWDLNGSPAGAAAILEDQIANSTRHVFMGSDVVTTGTWLRYDTQDIFTNATLRTEFRSQLDISGGATNLEAVEVVNFVRDIRQNPGALALSPAPQDPPRPSGYSVLGDIYHSQPVVVSPPNNFMYFSDYGLGPAHNYLGFRTKHAKRRRVVLAGANDGQLHAFDGGFYNRDTTNFPDRHDMGNGVELFAWVPEAVTGRLARMTYGTEQLYTVDGLISVGEVFIDHDGDSNRDWRTVALSTMRRGGRGVLALDITTPDPVLSAGDYTPSVSTFPGCLDGTASGCDAEYPKVLWEFHDVDNTGAPNDSDGNCPFTAGDPLCEPYWDLGWTWSKPVIARIGVYFEDGGGNVVPDDVFVAFFGGGWDATETDATGNYFYGVDIETGATVLKELIGVAVPGSPTILDSDNDGFHDKIYFGDTNGRVWRLQYPSPFLPAATGADAGTLRRIFDASVDLADPDPLVVEANQKQRQQFFVKPTLVPLIFNGVSYTYAVAMGAGDRANLGEENRDTINRFYVFLDDLDNDSVTNPAYDLTDLVALNYDNAEIVNTFTAQPGSTVCETSAFDAHKGWYLSLREDEKVNYDATVFSNHVYFTTFEPGDTLTAGQPILEFEV